MITIVVKHEDGQSDEFDFDSSKSNISIGRRSSNDVCIPNLSVSGRHARIVFNDGEAWIEDLNSTNGTYINSRLISRQMLNHNDELFVGKTRVRFENTNAGKTMDASAPIATRGSVSNMDPLDDSMQISTLSSADMEPTFQAPGVEPAPESMPHTKPRVGSAHMAAAAGAAGAAGVAGAAMSTTNGKSPEAMFDSLADDLGERQAQPTGGSGHDLNEPKLPDNQDSPMSLSEKARLALGRDNDRPPLAAVNGTGGTASNGVAHVTDDFSDTKTRSAPPSVETEKKVGAVIEIKNGAKSGQILPIDKPVTTLGRPGIQIAAIMRKPDGYFLMHIESDDSVDRPTLNNDAIGDEPMLLHSGDELNVAGIDVEFSLD